MKYWAIAAAHFVFGSIPGAYRPYQEFQKRFGGLKNPRFVDRLNVHVSLSKAIKNADGKISGTRMMEVGTGRIITCPVGFYLCGAESTDTYDVTPFVDSDLTIRFLDWLKSSPELIRDLYGEDFNQARYVRLCACNNLSEILECCSIRLHCPGDAANTHCADDTYDLHVSQNTFEHIDAKTLKKIVHEAHRVLKPGGLACHLIDHSDHWAKRDSSKNSIHFLRYTDFSWNLMAGNKYAYLNRLRSSEVRDIFKDAGFHELGANLEIDNEARNWLERSGKVAERFRNFSVDDLATVTSILVYRK